LATLRKRIASGGGGSSDGTFLPDESALNYFSSVSLPGGADQDMLVYTVPAGKTLYLGYAQAGGQNIARYDLLIDGVLQDRRRTYYAGDFSVEFSFFMPNRFGLPVTQGKQVKIRARHDNPLAGNFEGKITGVLKG
jgi:hypothetical protein